MKTMYCLPILKTSKDEVVKMIQKNVNEYQYFEVWLDYIDNIDNIFVNTLVNMLGDKLILLFQRGKERKVGLSDEKKIQILEQLHNTEIYLDLDISETKELKYIVEKKMNIKTIISYHNYEETPFDLGQTIKQMDKWNPVIYKIATRCTNEMDALKLLLIQQNFREMKKSHIVLGMGEFGTITRVYGTLWGNKLVYAPPTKHEASAPGQLTKKELETILKILVPSL
jgi:3-dehydroquinate dehydratase type I